LLTTDLISGDLAKTHSKNLYCMSWARHINFVNEGHFNSVEIHMHVGLDVTIQYLFEADCTTIRTNTVFIR